MFNISLKSYIRFQFGSFLNFHFFQFNLLSFLSNYLCFNIWVIWWKLKIAVWVMRYFNIHTHIDNNYLKLNWFFFISSSNVFDVLFWVKCIFHLNYAYCRLHCKVTWIVIRVANWHVEIDWTKQTNETANAHSN